MNLYILRPVDGNPAWVPWYDKAFGFIVRAESHAEARVVVSRGDSVSGAYDDIPGDEGADVWLDHSASTCMTLAFDVGRDEGPGVIMRDFAAA